MELPRLWRRVQRDVATTPRWVRGRLGPRVVVEPVVLTSTSGYRLRAERHRTADGGTSRPGLVVSPAILQGVEGLRRWSSPVTAMELAQLGYDVLVHDPAGRGESWGDEDFGGPEHADGLRCAVRFLQGQPDVAWVGVLSLSLGVCAASAALASWPDEMSARWLVDWEGPSDREVITTGGTRMAPAAGHTLEDDAYWAPREPVHTLMGVRCGYWRLQAAPDHAQKSDLRHAGRMIHAAAAAHASGTLPWFALNDHARNEAPARPRWLRGGSANADVLRVLASLRDA